MVEREILRKIEDFRELGLPPYTVRDGKISVVKEMVSTIIGARRAGKSYRALQFADELVKAGWLKSLDQVCHLDFDNPILGDMSSSGLKLIQETFLKANPDFKLRTPLLFILDEIHKIAGWEDYVIELSRNPAWKVIVTGSSSRMIRDEIATELRGKAVSSVIFPLSFIEYLRFKLFSGSSGSTKGRAETRRLFDGYLKWGGYPALVNEAEYIRESLLREYFDTMILKDVIQRYNVSKPQQCIHLYNYLLAGMGKPHTLLSSYEYLKNCGFATSRDSVRDYIKWAEDSWLLFIVSIHSDSLKEKERNYSKLYCIDWALSIRNSVVWDGSYSRALENMVFLHLIRRFKRVNYYLTRSKRQEVDFLASDAHGKPVFCAQVCMDISASETYKREIEPLIATARYFNTKENLIITMNQSRQIKEQGVTVNIVPAWEWLL
jgi:predicted AAA+ superfamily ATPase